MTVRDHQRGGQRIDPDYVCQRQGIASGAVPCQRIQGRNLDMAIAQMLLAVMTPDASAVTLAIQDE